MAQSNKLIVICGPTATGKTKLGVAYVVKDGVSYAVVLFG